MPRPPSKCDARLNIRDSQVMARCGLEADHEGHHEQKWRQNSTDVRVVWERGDVRFSIDDVTDDLERHISAVNRDACFECASIGVDGTTVTRCSVGGRTAYYRIDTNEEVWISTGLLGQGKVLPKREAIALILECLRH